MDQPRVAMELALRVLTAITEHREPEKGDMEELRLLAPSYVKGADELACEVVHQASKALKLSIL